ncbi:MAG: SpoIIE family protein phosphatase [Desulfobacterales bacterium]|jgi:PAS domain S-box-containing protein|nr:SpoIIE family protein phosphatase [Desulfobacterales bacterium]MCU0561775.1 SpoIIE family protein phosphatase [Desulfobacterales bacterium]
MKEPSPKLHRIADENTALRVILEGTATATGERFFEELVVSLATALGTHGAWVAEYLEERHQLRALAFWADGRMIRDHLMDIQGTPCEAVIRSTSLVHCPDHLIDLFPAAPGLAGSRAVSYLGAPLLDPSGKVTGNLAVLDTRPMPDAPHTRAVFQIFAARAAAELQRLKAERQLRQSEEKFRRIIATTAEGFILLDKNFVITEVNHAFCEMVGYRRDEIIGHTPLKFAAADYRQFLRINRDGFFARGRSGAEAAVMTRTGRIVPVLIQADALRDGQGEVIGNMVFVIDMTQQKRSLALAAEVQRSLLPQEPPAVEGLDIAGRTLSCEEIGGDYFDYLYGRECPGDRISLVVGDVAGHGIDAALLMTTARAFLRMRASQCGSISQIVTEMNRHLAHDVNDSGRFMTLSYVRLDAASGSLQWIRAGHPPALIYDPEHDRFRELMGEGLPLGVDPNFQYTEYAQTSLAPGQLILVGTDGIWESEDRNGGAYGKMRFHEVVRRHAAEPAQALLEAVYADIKTFTAGALPQDDITLVVVKRTDPLAASADWQI